MTEAAHPESEDAEGEATTFLRDLNVALGNEYADPGHAPFPAFAPHFAKITMADPELPLAARLAKAYADLAPSRRDHARRLVEVSQVRCSRSPLGLRRSLACIDLAYAIDPAMWSEELYTDFLLRPVDPNELARWILQLIRRWHRWNIKVKASPDAWRTAMRGIASEGLFDLLSYIHAQHAVDDSELWSELRKIALDRLEAEEDDLRDTGQDPDVLHERIWSLIVPPEHPIERDFLLPGVLSAETRQHRVKSLVRESAGRASLQDQGLETEWRPSGANG